MICIRQIDSFGVESTECAKGYEGKIYFDDEVFHNAENVLCGRGYTLCPIYSRTDDIIGYAFDDGAGTDPAASERVNRILHILKVRREYEHISLLGVYKEADGLK